MSSRRKLSRSGPDPPSDTFPFQRPLMRLMPAILANQGFKIAAPGSNDAVELPLWFSLHQDPAGLRRAPYDLRRCGSFNLFDLVADDAGYRSTKGWQDKLLVALEEACSEVSVKVHNSAYEGHVWVAFVPAQPPLPESPQSPSWS